MKETIGIILIILSLIVYWIGLSLLFYSDGLGLLMSIILPLCIFIGEALIVAFASLMGWLSI